MRGILAWSATAAILSVPGLLVACGDGGATPSDAGSEAALPDAGFDSATDAGDAAPDATPDATDAAPDAGVTVYSIDLDPLTITPSYSPSTHDYSVRCAAGDNVVTLTVVDSTGTHTSTVHLVENQELVVDNDYYVRCLPHDFPVIAVATYTGNGLPTPGYYLVNAKNYAIVLDTNGTPVWYEPGTSAFNVDAQRHDQISFLPNAAGPFGSDPSVKVEVHALDTLTTTTVQAVGVATDLHEFQTLPNGDYLVTAYPLKAHVDLTGLGSYGSDETLADCQIQELDPQDNLVWSWTGSDHMDPVKESLEPITATVNSQPVVDAFHCNAIDVDSNGNLLLSSRHTNAVYFIDRTSGTIQWKLGGTAYNKDGAAHLQVTSDSQTTFNMQHDARFAANGDVTLFDDHGADNGTSNAVARGVEYSLDHDAGTAAVAFQYLGSGESHFQGSFRRYADGESVIGWGYVPGDPRVVTEVNANGDPVLDIWFLATTPIRGISYRAVKVPLSQLDISVLRSTAAK
jgi:hypothetical protein